MMRMVGMSHIKAIASRFHMLWPPIYPSYVCLIYPGPCDYHSVAIPSCELKISSVSFGRVSLAILCLRSVCCWWWFCSKTRSSQCSPRVCLRRISMNEIESRSHFEPHPYYHLPSNVVIAWEAKLNSFEAPITSVRNSTLKMSEMLFYLQSSSWNHTISLSLWLCAISPQISTYSTAYSRTTLMCCSLAFVSITSRDSPSTSRLCSYVLYHR